MTGAGAGPAPDRSLAAAFAAAARAWPDRTALCAAGVPWSYARLAAAAAALAARIDGTLARPGAHRIALLVRDPVRQVIGTLATLHAGHAFVPLDPSLPAAWLRAFLADVLPAAVLADAAALPLAEEVLGGAVPRLVADADPTEGGAVAPTPPRPRPAAAMACILATSGTTGRPRGVVQTHRNLLRNATKVQASLDLVPGDRVAMLGHVAFAATQTDVFSTLLAGATLVPYDLAGRGTLGLADWLAAERITVLFLVPSVLRRFADLLAADATLPHVRLLKLAGEPVLRRDVDRVRRLLWPGARVLCSLGCSELNTVRQFFLDPTTDWDGPLVPVGHAVPGVTVRLEDEDGAPVPSGAIGRLVIESEDLFPGYWRRPAETRARLTRGPDGRPRFRSGDLGRMLPDDCLLVVGRDDGRIKRLGRGVDPAEVETVAALLPGVASAAVVVAGNDAAPRLVAHIAPRAGFALAAATLRAELAARLPAAALPDGIVLHAALPTLPNGKIDRARLAALAGAPQNAGRRAARGSLEEGVLRVLQDVLRTPRLAPDDDVVAAGADSLALVEVAARLARAYGVLLPASRLLDAPTAAAIAARVAAAATAAAGAEAVELATFPGAGGLDRAPLLCVAGAGSDALLFGRLVARLPGQPLRAFHYPGHDGRTPFLTDVGAIARQLVDAARRALPAGPFLLHGHSFGGVVAHAAAARLTAAGEPVALLSMVDTRAPDHAVLAHRAPLARRLGDLAHDGRRSLRRLLRGRPATGTARSLLRRQRDACLRALAVHQPPRYPGSIVLFRSGPPPADPDGTDPTLGWAAHAATVDVVWLDVKRAGALRPRAAARLAAHLAPRIAAALAHHAERPPRT